MPYSHVPPCCHSPLYYHTAILTYNYTLTAISKTQIYPNSALLPQYIPPALPYHPIPPHYHTAILTHNYILTATMPFRHTTALPFPTQTILSHRHYRHTNIPTPTLPCFPTAAMPSFHTVETGKPFSTKGLPVFLQKLRVCSRIMTPHFLLYRCKRNRRPFPPVRRHP